MQFNIKHLLLCYTLTAIGLVQGSYAQDNSSDSTLDEVVVIGSRLDLQQHQLGSAVTIVTAEDIQNNGSAFVADVLRHVPGLAVGRTGPAGGLTQVRMRGTEGNHVLVIIDGVEANPPNGEYDFSTLTTANIERIEVLRGAQGGIYGSNATAGVINITTRTPTEQAQINVQVESGSLDFNRQALSASGGNELAQGSLSLSHQRIAFNASESGSEDDLSENYAASVQGTLLLSDNVSITTGGNYSSRDYDFDGQPGRDAIDADYFGDSKETSAYLTINARALDNSLINKLQYDESNFENNSIDGFGPSGNRGSRDRLAFHSRWDFDQQGDTQQRVTIYYEIEKEFYRNTISGDPEQSRRLHSTGVEYFIDLNQSLFLSAGYRSDNNDDFENASTYHIAGRWVLSDRHNLHASIGTGITNPSFFEQFGFFPAFYIGNPELEPEEQQSWDLGWELTLLDGQLATDITYFDLMLEKEIAGFSSPFNLQTDSERQGVEFTMAWKASKGFNLNASYTYTDAEQLDEMELRRPENMGALDAVLPFANNRLQWQLGLVYNGSMVDTDFSTFLPAQIDAYTVVNTSLRYFYSDNIEAFIRLNNIFDEDYQEVIGFNTPGFHGSAGVAMRF